MGWRKIVAADILTRFTVSEQAMLTNASGAKSALQTRLDDAIAAFDSAMVAAGYEVAPPPQMVDSLRNPVMALAAWEWLKDFPALKAFATDARREAAKDAAAELTKIANRLGGAIEPPPGYVPTQSWNSSNAVVHRMQPVPPPDMQWSNAGNPWPATANPNAESEATQLQVPAAPKNCYVYNGAPGVLTVNWVLSPAAFVYNVYRGAASGAETLLASVPNNNFYTDTAVTSGQTWVYYIIAVNAIGASAKSNEASATVK